VPEVSLRDQLKKFVELQKFDGEIYHLKRKLKENPLAVNALEQEFEKEKSKLHALEAQLKAIFLDRKQKELELKSKEDEIVKVNGQLSQIKTNKEYAAKIAEIESIKADKSIFEEKILVLFDEGDTVNVEIEKEKKTVVEHERKFLSKRKEIEEDSQVCEGQLAALHIQRKQMLTGMEVNFLRQYERTLEHKDGLAIVALQGLTCGGCNMNVTQQKINLIKMHDEIVTCDMCTRILYLEEDL